MLCALRRGSFGGPKSFIGSSARVLPLLIAWAFTFCVAASDGLLDDATRRPGEESNVNVDFPSDLSWFACRSSGSGRHPLIGLGGSTCLEVNSCDIRRHVLGLLSCCRVSTLAGRVMLLLLVLWRAGIRLPHKVELFYTSNGLSFRGPEEMQS